MVRAVIAEGSTTATLGFTAHGLGGSAGGSDGDLREGDDRVVGGEGDHVLRGQAGADTLEGGPGDDEERKGSSGGSDDASDVTGRIGNPWLHAFLLDIEAAAGGLDGHAVMTVSWGSDGASD